MGRFIFTRRLFLVGMDKTTPYVDETFRFLGKEAL